MEEKGIEIVDGEGICPDLEMLLNDEIPMVEKEWNTSESDKLSNQVTLDALFQE